LHDNIYSCNNDVGNVPSAAKEMDVDDVDDVEWDRNSNDTSATEKQGSLIMATNLMLI